MLNSLMQSHSALSHLPPTTLFFGPAVVLSTLFYFISRVKEFAVIAFSASIYALVPFVAVCHL